MLTKEERLERSKKYKDIGVEDNKKVAKSVETKDTSKVEIIERDFITKDEMLKLGWVPYNESECNRVNDKASLPREKRENIKTTTMMRMSEDGVYDVNSYDLPLGTINIQGKDVEYYSESHKNSILDKLKAHNVAATPIGDSKNFTVSRSDEKTDGWSGENQNELNFKDGSKIIF